MKSFIVSVSAKRFVLSTTAEGFILSVNAKMLLYFDRNMIIQYQLLNKYQVQ